MTGHIRGGKGEKQGERRRRIEGTTSRVEEEKEEKGITKKKSCTCVEKDMKKESWKIEEEIHGTFTDSALISHLYNTCSTVQEL